MTTPTDPYPPTDDRPDAPEAVPAPPPAPQGVPVGPAVDESTHPATGSGHGPAGKVTIAAVLAGAAALATKVRQEAPKKVQEFKEKRVAGRCLLLTESGGRQVAIGPYPDEWAARADLGKVSGGGQVVELKSRASFFGPESEVDGAR